MSSLNALMKVGENALTKGTTKAVTKAGAKAGTKALTGLAAKSALSLMPKAVDTVLPKVMTGGLKPTTTQLTKLATSPKTPIAIGDMALPTASTNKVALDTAIKANNAKLADRIAGGSMAEISDDFFNIGNYNLRKSMEDNISDIATKNNNLLSNPETGVANYDFGVLGDAKSSGALTKTGDSYALDPTKLSNQQRERMMNLMSSYDDGTGVAEFANEKFDTTSPSLFDMEAPAEAIDVKRIKNTPTEKRAETMKINEAPAEPDYTEVDNLRAKMGLDTTAEQAQQQATMGAGFDQPVDYGELNVEFKKSGTAPTTRQIGRNKQEDNWLKGMNATPTGYKEMATGKFYGGGTYSRRLMDAGVTPANVAERVETTLGNMESIKQTALKQATDGGMMIDLTGVGDNLNILVKKSPVAQRVLDTAKELQSLSPLDAEEFYKTVRDMAQNANYTGEETKALKSIASEVSSRIDKSMDVAFPNMKQAMADALQASGDPKRAKSVMEMNSFKFSDIRKEQAPFMTANENLVGRPAKNTQNIKILGVDTGIPNFVSGAGEKVGEGFANWQAKGGFNRNGANSTGAFGLGSAEAGAGGAGGAGVGAEAGAEMGGKMPLRGKIPQGLKDAGLIGGGAVLGALLGSGGGSGNTAMPTGMGLGGGLGTTTATDAMMAEPEEELTIGGYNYDQLEQGYVNAMLAGDVDAAKYIAQMIGMLDDKASRVADAKSSASTGSGIGEKQQAALNVLQSLYNQYHSIGEGNTGVIQGRMTGFLNNLTGGGYNTNAYAFDSTSRGTLGTIVKSLGDSGALSEGDQQRAIAMLPSITDSEQAAEQKFQALYNLILSAGTTK